MFAARGLRMLASMSERAETTPLNWSDLGVSELPTGTVTLLLADVEGSTRLWQTQPEEMTPRLARLDRALADLVAAHGGVRPVEQGEGDSFVVAFARASDAVACALRAAAGTAGADPAAHRRAHRRGAAARRGQLHRPDHQPHCPAMSNEEAIAYAQRGRGERKRPASGWASLTPAERDVVRRSSAKGSPTKTSPQGFSCHRAPCRPTSPTSTPNSASRSRVQLAQEAARHT